MSLSLVSYLKVMQFKPKIFSGVQPVESMSQKGLHEDLWKRNHEYILLLSKRN